MEDEDDPFSVVKLEKDNKKMSTYLKKQRMIASAADRGGPHKCAVEEASLATTSTRSTTISNRTDDNLYLSSSSVVSGGSGSVLSGGSVKSGGSGRSGGSGSGLKGFETRTLSSSGDSNYGGGVGDAYGFGNFDSLGVADESHAIEFGSDFGNGLEFGNQGGGSALGGDPFGGGGDFGGTGSSGSGSKIGKGGRAGGGRRPTSGSQSRKPQCTKDSDGQGDDGFGFGKPQSKSDFTGGDDGFGTDPFAADPFPTDDFNQPFEEEPVNFGDDGGTKFEADFFSGGAAVAHRTIKTPSPSGDKAWKKREEWRTEPRTNSAGSGNVNRRGASRRGGLPRRHHSTDSPDLDLLRLSDDAPSPPVPPASRTRHPPGPGVRDRDRRTSDGSVSSGGRTEAKHQPPPRTRSGRSRRASLDYSGHSGEGSLYSTQTESSELSTSSSHLDSRRRSSVGYSQPERSLGAPEKEIIPASSHSQGPIPTGSRRARPRRNSSVTSGVIDSFGGDADSFATSVGERVSSTDQAASSGDGRGTADKWSRDRSRNQELIMTMYKDGAMKKSEDRPKSSSSLFDDSVDGDMGSFVVHDQDAHMDSARGGLGKILKNPFAGNSSSQFGASIGGGVDVMTAPAGPADYGGAAAESRRSDRKKSLPSFRLSKGKKDEPPEEERTTADTRNMMGRSRGTLLERVGAVDANTSAPAGGGGISGGGSSYSDRILKQQQRGRE
jgi:hypothetical protein